jgi:hypothetical protein
MIALCCCTAPYALAQSTDSVRTTAGVSTDSLDAEQKNIELLTEETIAGQPLKVFGTMQTFLFLARYRNAFFAGRPNADLNQNTFALQQMDVFLRKELGNDFTFFADIELRLNYDSRLNFGGMSIQEAWVNYEYSSAFHVKAGLLFPVFNNMNEIKNRLGILPYIIRPLVYERSLAEIVGSSELLPDRAFLQIHGSKRIHSLLFDYAVYFGNADNEYLSTNQQAPLKQSPLDLFSGTNPPGINYALIGTRFGIRNTKETFKAGISFTYDRAPFFKNSDSVQVRRFSGDFPRIRVGGDASFSWGNFWFETEFIHVFHDAYSLRDFPDLRYSRTFAYTTFGYNVSSRWTAYLLTQTLNSDNIGFAVLPTGGITPTALQLRSNSFSIGTSYRTNNSVTIKGQFQNTFFEVPLPNSTVSNTADLTQFLLGITVNF